MRSRIAAGGLLVLALLIPAAPAMAHTGSPGLTEACQTVERKTYKDLRTLLTIDLDAASVTDVRLLANQIHAAAKTNSLSTLPGKIQERLNGTADDLRAFLKTNLLAAWSIDLRIAVNQTMPNAGAAVQKAAQKALNDATVDAYLAYLNNGLYDARAIDCASHSASPTSASTSTSPSASAPASPSRAATATASPTTSTPAAAGLPVTGTNTGIMAAIGAILVLLGGASILVARRRRANTGA
jgi:LPXTG-motif cell wall-anchored protein